MARFDIEIVNNDAVIRNGDFHFVQSDAQHIQDTIEAFPGWWKEFPNDGVGIRSWQGGPANLQSATKSIRLNLERDGYSVNNPKVTFDAQGQLIISPNATI